MRRKHRWSPEHSSAAEQEIVAFGYDLLFRPQIRQGYPLNLSISISGGKETNQDSLSNGERNGKSPTCKSPACRRIVVYRSISCCQLGPSVLERAVREGENPVGRVLVTPRSAFPESGCLRMQPKFGGKSHLRLNTDTRPIANKYREGKMKRTLKRELKSA